MRDLSTPQTGDLVAFYPFNGNAGDESGNGNNGTVNGAVLAADRFGQAGRAYSFNGTGAYINVPDSTSLDLTSAGTLMLWFNARALTKEWYALVGKNSNATNAQMNYQAHLGFNSNLNKYQLVVTGADGTKDLQCSFNPVVAGKWYHVAFVFDGKDFSLYLDGKLSMSVPQTLVPAANMMPLQMGAWASNPSGGYYFDGLLDDVRIHSKALSAAEVESFYGEGGWPAI